MTMCKGTPISWLRLERFALGEGGESERLAIEAHLAECEVCATCLKAIEADCRDLPPLVVPGRGNVVPLAVARQEARARRSWLRKVAPVASLAALAAALVLLARTPSSRLGRSLEGGSREKGVGYMLELQREGGGSAIESGYRDGEPIKVVVTCPPGMTGSLDVVVFEDGVASFPMVPVDRPFCGNGLAMPGAFRLTGSREMTVCLVWNERGPIDRDELRRRGAEATESRICHGIGPQR